MKTVFADTGYWIALLDPQDTLHSHAVNLSVSLAQGKICTSEMVLTEVLNHFSKRGTFLKRAAIALIQNILDSPAIEVVPQPANFFRLPSTSTNNVSIKHGAIPIAPRSASCNNEIFKRHWLTTSILSKLASLLYSVSRSIALQSSPFAF